MTNLEAAKQQFTKGLQLRNVMGNFAAVKLETLGALLDCAVACTKGKEAPEIAVRYLRQEVSDE